MFVRNSILRNWKRLHQWKDPKFHFHSNAREPFLDMVSWNNLITEHARKGDVDLARQVFDEMPLRTVASWNALISGYKMWGRTKEALDVVSEMHQSGTKLNEASFSASLSACSRLRSLYHGFQVHCLVLKSRYEVFELVGSSLLNMYSSCLKISEARKVFNELHARNPLLWSLMLVGYVQCNLINDALNVFMQMPTRDVVSWTAMIAGYSKSDDECQKALKLFHLMRVSGEADPNEFTLDSVIRVCGKLGVLNKGKMIHGLLIKSAFEPDESIGGGLIEFYCKCDAVEDAKKVYDRLVEPCVSASNLLIEGYISMGRIDDAESVFSRMLERSPVSYNLMIKGYGLNDRIEDSRMLLQIMPQRTLVSSNTMISVYCRSGKFNEALKLFEETKGHKNTVTWNSMIAGYVQNEQAEVAFKLYVTMHRLAVEKNRSTFSTLFRASSSVGALQQGKLLHAHVVKTPFESNVYVGTSLVDMYAKCGSLSDAQASFRNIFLPNVPAWTALINGYAHHGLGDEAISLFKQMLKQGIHPNVVTFVGLLTACGRAGLVNEGMKIFRSMEKYGLVPTLEHYACVVDLLGRSGLLKEAEEFVKRMPIEPDAVVWGALLSACWFFMDMEVGQRVAERMFGLEPKQISAYVIMSNIYAGVGRWEEVVKVRKKLRSMEVKKDPGCSWIEMENTVHVFCVEDRNHPRCNEIYTILEELTANVYSISVFDHALYQCQNHDFFSFFHCFQFLHLITHCISVKSGSCDVGWWCLQLKAVPSSMAF